METRAEQIRQFILENVENHPHDLVAVTAKHFGVTRTTVHRHLSKLIEQGEVLKSGRKNKVVYSLKSSFNKELTFPITPDLDESKIWSDHFSFLRGKIPENVYWICEYGFTEMVNNAKDHSGGKTVVVRSKRSGDTLELFVWDDGIGVFRKIKEAFHLDDEKESAFQLSKGKLTTDAANHSGEGIFFTSRAFDRFTLVANGLAYIRDNEQDDWFLERRVEKNNSSTLVLMEISVHSTRELNAIFKRYTDPETDRFDRTHIVVNLALSGEERFVSRSQAKRVLFQLEKFKHIVLDFKGVEAVGQGFVDEVFRVFKNKHPDIVIDYINANDVVDFMIRRGIATAQGRNSV